jgi:hypothetical protein
MRHAMRNHANGVAHRTRHSASAVRWGEATKRAVVAVGHQGAGGRQIYNFGCRFRIYQPARLSENGSMFLLPVCGEQHWGRCLTLPFTLRPFCRFPVPHAL